METTTQRLKARHPDLNFVKPLPVENHPRHKPFNVTFKPGQRQELPKRHVKEEGRNQRMVDCILEHDTAPTMRDGAKLYADVFRPTSSDGNEKVPAVICWSPLDVRLRDVRGIGPRGLVQEGLRRLQCGRSRNAVLGWLVPFWGKQEAEDVYDAIDFLSKQPWCNGAVAMGGTSYLAKAQVNYASRQAHSALKCLAPWEGFSDTHRQLLCRGGFAMNNVFMKFYQWGIAGKHEVEDMERMVKTHPFFDDYWADKYDKPETIDVSMYQLGFFSNSSYVQGTFDTFRRAETAQKWRRVHARFEWYELYEPNSMDDLQRFYDRFCKDTMNGWESDTPPLRLSLHGLGTIPSIIERHETQFPLARQQLKTYYFDAATKSIAASPPKSESTVTHEGHSLSGSSVSNPNAITTTPTDPSNQDFTLRFDQHTELAGYTKVRLWMSCAEHDDLDVVVHLRKVDSTGTPIAGLNFPAPVPESAAFEGETAKFYGPQGFLRASSAVTRDESRCSADGQEVFYRHDREEKIKAGTVVPLKITLWPTGMVFAAGEGLMLRVAGHFLSAPSSQAVQNEEGDDENVGLHRIHTGGKFDSQLIVPIVSGRGSKGLRGQHHGTFRWGVDGLSVEYK